MLIAGRRKVHEIWISSELEGDAGVDDIVTIANSQRVPVVYIAKSRLEREARSEAPQGVLAKRPSSPKPTSGPCCAATERRRRSSSRSTG